MKKNYLIILFFILCGGFVSSQVIFEEDFNGIPGQTNGGAGTYAFPEGWLLRNVDNKTPATSVSYVNKAWTRREDFKNDVTDSAAVSTSWYSPVGQSDDWMWTPEITTPSDGEFKLSWRAVAYDAEFRDGYEVRIMKVPNSPTGGNGVIGNQVTNSTLLYTNPGEETAWTKRSVDISDYKNSTFRIAFRNNSVDKFLLWIDDVKVERVINNDLAVISGTKSEYTNVPLSQARFVLGATVQNLGINPLSNVKVRAEIYNLSNELVTSMYSNVVSSLAKDATVAFSFDNWAPTEIGSYYVEYVALSDELDDNTANNSMRMTAVKVTENTYARDNGVPSGSLGIGAEALGYLGQSFTITKEVFVDSGTVSFSTVTPTDEYTGVIGGTYQLALWSTDSNGRPLSNINETEILTFSSNEGFTQTIPFKNRSLKLAPGKYVLTAVERDVTLPLSNTNEIFTLGTVFVAWEANAGYWSNVEQFGVAFSKSFALRLNLLENDPTLGLDNVLGSRLNVYPNPNKGLFVIDAPIKEVAKLYHINGQFIKTIVLDKGKNEINMINQPTGMYILKTSKGDTKIVKQ